MVSFAAGKLVVYAFRRWFFNGLRRGKERFFVRFPSLAFYGICVYIYIYICISLSLYLSLSLYIYIYIVVCFSPTKTDESQKATGKFRIRVLLRLLQDRGSLSDGNHKKKSSGRFRDEVCIYIYIYMYTPISSCRSPSSLFLRTPRRREIISDRGQGPRFIHGVYLCV